MTLTGPSRTLYVSDLDGTLLDADGTMSAATREVLAEQLAAGTAFTVATARGPVSSLRVLDGLPLELPLIVYSGAAATDASGRPLWYEHFDGRVVRPLIGAALAAGATPLVFWLDGADERISWVRGAETTEVEEFLYDRDGDPRLLPVDGWDEVDLDRAFFVSVPGQGVVLRRLARMIRAISWGRGCALALAPREDGAAMLDVTADTATKGAAAARIAEELGYERIVAFGDGANDLPLFRTADEAYAIGNAPEEVRAAATAAVDGPDAVARTLATLVARAAV